VIRIHDCEQGTPEWYALRLGMPTMSRAATILASGKGGGDSLTRRRYLHELAAERITGRLNESYNNSYMDRGRAQEAVARSIYSFVHEVEPKLVGFIHAEEIGCGCSPDALVGDLGVLEIKTRLPALQVELLAANRPPPEHKAQIQGNLWLTERSWCDLVVYCEGLPLFVDRQRRDNKYIEKLALEVMRFNEELDKICERVRRYGMPLTQALRESV
jgi:hypothetical protein